MLGIDRCFSLTCDCPKKCQFVNNSSCQEDAARVDCPEFSECQNRENEGTLDLSIKWQVISNIFP